MAKDTRTCRTCILDSQTPGVTINPETGLCQFCEQFVPISQEKTEENRARKESLLNSPPAGGIYDVIFALSGGVDSSYTLYRLKRDYPNLKILAVQFDNGFISETALENARKFCTLTNSTYLRLALDQDTLRDTFHKAAVSKDAYPGFAKFRASDICNTCISIVKQRIIELAMSTKSPFIVFAFSPGQTDAPFITLTKPFLGWMRNIFEGNLKAMGVTERDAYLIDADLIRAWSGPEITIIHPFLIWEYNKPAFKQECIRLGWIDPKLKDHNSSNCLLNAFAIKNHLDKYNIHPYAHDTATLVRRGNMKREDGLKKIIMDVDDPSLEEVRRDLHL